MVRGDIPAPPPRGNIGPGSRLCCKVVNPLASRDRGSDRISGLRQGSIRFPLGKGNTEKDIDTTVEALVEIVDQLRAISSL